MFRNVAGQKLGIYLYNKTTGLPVTGEAENITAQISLDFGTPAATDDTNPTELSAGDMPGQYYFNVTQGETDADVVWLYAVCSTSGDYLIGPVSTHTVEPMRGTDGAPTVAQLLDARQRIIDMIESQRGAHTAQGTSFYVDPVNGDTHANGNRGGKDDPYSLVQDCLDNAVTDSAHDVIHLVAGESVAPTILTEDVTVDKRYVFIRGPGRDFIWKRSGNGDTIAITAAGVEISGCQVETDTSGNGDGIAVVGADFAFLHHLWFERIRGNGVSLAAAQNCIVAHNHIHGAGQGGASNGVLINAAVGDSSNNQIFNNHIEQTTGDGIKVTDAGGGNTINTTDIHHNLVIGCTGTGINIEGANVSLSIIYENRWGKNTEDFADTGTNTVTLNNTQYSEASALATAQASLGALPSAAQTVTALLNTTGVTAGGVVTVAEMLAVMFAYTRGRIVRDGNVYTYYDDDDSTPTAVLTAAANERTTS